MVTWTGSTPEAVEFVWSENFHRRHLNPGQRAIAVIRREQLIARFRADAAARQRAAGAYGGRGRKKTLDDPDCPLTVNPAARLRKLLIDPKHLKRRRLTKDQYFERDEAALLVETARDHFAEWYPFVLCGVRSGLRLGELIGLQWGDIDWRKGFIHVQRAYVLGAWTTPKNHEDRTVDMSRQLRAELWLRRRRQAADYLKRGLGRPKHVFPSAVNTPVDQSNVRKAFLAILRKAELRHRPIHSMRHTFISLLLQSGASPAYVQKQAGHKSMDLTINVYGHFVPGGNRDAIDRLDDVTGKPSQNRHKRAANS